MEDLKEYHKEISRSLNKVLKTKEGKDSIQAIMDMTGFFDYPDKDETAEQFVARRNVGLSIYNLISKER